MFAYWLSLRALWGDSVAATEDAGRAGAGDRRHLGLHHEVLLQVGPSQVERLDRAAAVLALGALDEAEAEPNASSHTSRTIGRSASLVPRSPRMRASPAPHAAPMRAPSRFGGPGGSQRIFAAAATRLAHSVTGRRRTAGRTKKKAETSSALVQQGGRKRLELPQPSPSSPIYDRCARCSSKITTHLQHGRYALPTCRSSTHG